MCTLQIVSPVGGLFSHFVDSVIHIAAQFSFYYKEQLTSLLNFCVFDLINVLIKSGNYNNMYNLNSLGNKMKLPQPNSGSSVGGCTGT